MKAKDYTVYRFLERNSDRWVSKEEIVAEFPELFGKHDETSHDICSTLNTMRLRINKAASEGKLSHIVLLNNNRFKVATSREEAEKYCKRDFDNAMKLLKRYWQNIGVIKQDGQGKLIDCRGNVIDEKSLAKRFYMPFEV